MAKEMHNCFQHPSTNFITDTGIEKYPLSEYIYIYLQSTGTNSTINSNNKQQLSKHEVTLVDTAHNLISRNP